VTADSDARPNVLLILTDDQGWDDLGCHGNPWLCTPRLDALAAESVRFDDFTVAAVCAPTRASLLTGRHFLRTGVSHVHGGKDFVHRDERLISETFRAAGYRTAMWGKWHSGKTTGYLPWERGFEDAWMAQLYRHRDPGGYRNGEAVRYRGWTTELIAEHCCEFLDHRAEDGEPFFAFLPHLAPHAPLVADEALVASYRALGLSEGLATLYAMVEQVDASVGRVLDHLDARGLAEDTVVCFLSDNGPAYNGAELDDEDRRLRNVAGLLGHKGNLWQRGVRSPLFVRYPRACAPRTVRRAVDVCDLYPTLCELCGIELDDAHPPLDGRSVVDYLRGEETRLPPKRGFLWVHPGWPPDPARPYSIRGIPGEYDPVDPAAERPELQLAGVRDEAWKLMQHPSAVPDRPEPIDDLVLIDLAADPTERRNLAADQSERTAALRDAVRAWFDEIRAEPHAFHMPVFAIGGEGPHDFLAAYAPTRLRGDLFNTGNGLCGWCAPGDEADYRVRVDRPGRYRVAVASTRADERALELRLRCGEHAVEAALGSDGHDELGELELPAGEQDLTLSVTTADPGEGPILERVTTLRFTPVG